MRGYYLHDPEQYDFATGDLPALYLFPQGSLVEPERTAEDWRVLTDEIRVLWILPPAQPLVQSKRAVILRTVAHTLDRAIERGRDPSWIVDGDPDPAAQYEGSVLLRHAGLISAEAKRWTVARVAIASAAHLKSQPIDVGLFDALQTSIIIKTREVDLPGLNVEHPEWGPYAGGAFTGPSALELSVNNGASDAILLPGYTMLYVQGGATAQTIGTAPAKLTCFAAAGQAAGLTPDHAADRITVLAPGAYNVLGAFDVTGTSDRKVTLRLRRNGIVVDGVLGGAKIVSGAASFSLLGQVGCAEGDVLELYAEADENATSLTVVNATWALSRI